jgi:hypothetical protein
VTAVPLYQVQMMAPKRAAMEELPPDNSSISSVNVTDRLEYLDVSSRICARRPACRDVENGFRCESRDCRTADMFKDQFRKAGISNGCEDSTSLGLEKQRPPSVVRSQTHRL